jgi:hypothetical protein
MEPVFMDNDVGGIVFVGKNELRLCFANGIKHKILIKTKDLLQHIESRTVEEIETDKYVIEPMYKAPEGALLVIFTIKCKGQDDDKATVFRCDLLGVLVDLERPELAY